MPAKMLFNPSPTLPLGAAERWARKWLWALPLLASVLFVAGVLLWAHWAETEERAERHNTLIADALSSEAHLQNRLETEAARLRDLGHQLATLPRSPNGLAANSVVVDGLNYLWLSVTWLDANNRIVAHAPLRAPLSLARTQAPAEGAGHTLHLQWQVGAETLVVRYSTALLLRKAMPWWLTRKYDVQLIDGADQIIAAMDEVPLRLDTQGRDSYAVAMGAAMPNAYLELTSREPVRNFWRTLPLVLIAGFLFLMLIATLLLRRQVGQITGAVGALGKEAAWRRAMEDSALVGLRARDAEGRILYVNRTFCALVGLAEHDLVGLKPPLPYWPNDAVSEGMQRSERNLAGKAPRDGYEAVWQHRAGRQINVMVYESPLLNADGEQLGWMGSIIDITQRKQLEERERHQAEGMAQQARLITLGEVASALAHQLNQPLTAVISYSAGIQKVLQDAGYDHAVVLNALSQQEVQAKEAARIVKRIREFLTRRVPHREPLGLGDLLARTLELLARDLRANKLEVQLQLAAQLPLVYADAILIEQVLINLLRNAIDACSGAGQIRIVAAPSGVQFVRVDIEDNGHGLGGLGVNQLCAPFFSTKTDGMGMGLAICRSVIEVHHGYMDAGQSALGGARFSFTIPVYNTPSQLGS